jgi:hypothetical protein
VEHSGDLVVVIDDKQVMAPAPAANEEKSGG